MSSVLTFLSYIFLYLSFVGMTVSFGKSISVEKSGASMIPAHSLFLPGWSHSMYLKWSRIWLVSPCKLYPNILIFMSCRFTTFLKIYKPWLITSLRRSSIGWIVSLGNRNALSVSQLWSPYVIISNWFIPFIFSFAFTVTSKAFSFHRYWNF